MLVEPAAVDLHVLGVHVQDPVAEVVDRALVVDHLPHEVRRIEVEPEARVGDDVEHLAPDRRCTREVVAERPLVAREQHRAVLDRDLDALGARAVDHRGPDLGERPQVLGQRALGIGAHERADDLDAEQRGGVDDAAEMRVDLGAVLRIGVQVVGVVGERGDLEAAGSEQLVDRRRPGGVEVLDVDVRDAGVAPLLAAADRPAGDLERLEGARARPVGDLLEREVGEGSGQEAEFHEREPSVRPYDAPL